MSGAFVYLSLISFYSRLTRFEWFFFGKQKNLFQHKNSLKIKTMICKLVNLGKQNIVLNGNKMESNWVIYWVYLWNLLAGKWFLVCVMKIISQKIFSRFNFILLCVALMNYLFVFYLYQITKCMKIQFYPFFTVGFSSLDSSFVNFMCSKWKIYFVKIPLNELELKY